MTKNKHFLALFVVLVMISNPMHSQVTIGSDKVPETFSVLELISNDTLGLRLPQLTTQQRINITTAEFKLNAKAEGLTIFNIETRCVEVWNGTIWLSKCAPVYCTNLSDTYTFCSSPAPTISDLNDKAAAIVEWYDVETGGTPLATTTTLVNGKTYYAGNCTDMSNRRAVKVILANCGAVINAANSRVTTFTNVMYDFQTQVLESYVTSGGEPIVWQWKVSTRRNGTYNNITGATAAKFTIPAHFIDSYNPSELIDNELFFKCEMINPSTPAGAVTSDANALGIIFIRSTSANGSPIGNYGIDNGVRYLKIERGANGTIKGGTIKVALLNLGQSGTGSYMNGLAQNNDNGIFNDAGDLGDFYQWGRVADGHEHTVWKKDASYVNILTPTTGGGSATSQSVSRPADPVPYTYTVSPMEGQIPSSASNYYGNFIVTTVMPYDWSDVATANNRWGNGDNTRSGAPTSISNWSINTKNNNPCPAGWYVPSQYDFRDIYVGNGSDNLAGGSNYLSADNKWEWRSSANNAVGGAIITNASGEKLFLPALGLRSSNSATPGDLVSCGSTGLIWSSTYFSTNHAYNLSFYATAVVTGTGETSIRSHGMGIRCVKE